MPPGSGVIHVRLAKSDPAVSLLVGDAIVIDNAVRREVLVVTAERE
jgi:hypothetical protein